jgi:hypothetical protein
MHPAVTLNRSGMPNRTLLFRLLGVRVCFTHTAYCTAVAA